MDQALQWGEQYGIGVLIDLHAVPGSQNGQDNSAPAKAGQVCGRSLEVQDVSVLPGFDVMFCHNKSTEPCQAGDCCGIA